MDVFVILCDFLITFWMWSINVLVTLWVRVQLKEWCLVTMLRMMEDEKGKLHAVSKIAVKNECQILGL